MESKNCEEIDIDLLELVFALTRKIWIILLIGTLCALSTGLFSKFVVEPVYTSTTKMYIISRQNINTTTYSDIQTSTQLIKDYKILIKSRPITEQVIRDLKLNMTHEELISCIEVTAPSDTRIIEIQVSHPNAAIAKQIADSIAEISSDSMVSIMGIEKANIIEEGNLPTSPSSPNIVKNTVLGGVIGIVLTAGMIVLMTILNDSIQTEVDIERYLGLTVLGSIPLAENPKNNKKLKKEFKKSYKNTYKHGGEQNAFY